MPEPIYSATTERVYSNLPEIWRTQDELSGWELKSYLSSVLDQFGDVETMIDRFNFDALPDGQPEDTSDLVDPYAADVKWLPWLAQLVGQQIVSATTSITRSRIASPNKFKAGTKTAMAEAAKNVLTGEQRVTIFDHSTSAPGNGGQWDILIITKSSETVSDPAAEIIRVGAKPAGIILHTTTFEATWAAIEAGLPTWADWDAKTWGEIEETGL